MHLCHSEAWRMCVIVWGAAGIGELLHSENPLRAYFPETHFFLTK